MWMCHALILIDPRNYDGNTAQDIADALRVMGCEVDSIDDERHLIEACFASHELPTIQAMDGVAYVRNVHHYHARREPAAAA